MVNLNPPISLLFFRPLIQTDPYQAMVVWQVISATLYIIGVLLLTKTYQDRLSPAKFAWVFMLAGFWHTVVLGQIYVVLLLLTVLAWLGLAALTQSWRFAWVAAAFVALYLGAEWAGGREAHVRLAAALPGAAVLAGPWDLLACIAEPWEVASGIILDGIHPLPGVRTTSTLVSVDFDEPQEDRDQFSAWS